jgi:hypothetical protein
MKYGIFTWGNNLDCGLKLSSGKGLYCSVGIAMGYSLEGPGSIPGRVKWFSLLHSVQTGSGAHPVSYPMVLSSGRETDHSSPPNAKFKNGRTMPPLPHTS